MLKRRKIDFYSAQRPSKISTFLSGHFNRYISPPGEPNAKMQSRLAKYRLSFFKAACYSGVKYSQAKQNENFGKVRLPYEFEPGFHKTECLDSIEEAFQPGFCDPRYFRDKIIDSVHPMYDIDLFVV